MQISFSRKEFIASAVTMCSVILADLGMMLSSKYVFLCTVAQLSLVAVLINGGCYWIAAHDVAFWCNITLSCYTQSTLFAIFGLHLHSIISVKWLFVSCKVTYIQLVNPLNPLITSQKYCLTSFCSSEECFKLKKFIILLWITKFVE